MLTQVREFHLIEFYDKYIHKTLDLHTIIKQKLVSNTEYDMSIPTNTDFGPDSGGRVKVRYKMIPVLDILYIFIFQGVTIVKPLVYGNIARSFGKKRESDGHTHQWTVYVKPYLNEDLSVYVKKIHFKLHESYANSNRIVTKPPYEVTETGWGEFEIVIKIYFHDPTERPVTMYHILKLFQSPVVEGEVSSLDAKKVLVSEQYEEIVFQEPTQLMQQYLTNVQLITNDEWEHDTDCEYI